MDEEAIRKLLFLDCLITLVTRDGDRFTVMLAMHAIRNLTSEYVNICWQQLSYTNTIFPRLPQSAVKDHA